MCGVELMTRVAGAPPRDSVTNSGSARVTNRVTGTLRVTVGEGPEGVWRGKSPPRVRAGKIFFAAGRGMRLVTVSVEV